MKKILLLLAAFTLVAAACGSDDSSESATGSGGDVGVDVTDVWSRATAPTAANGAVYLTMESPDEEDALIGVNVESTVAASAEIHETVEADGDMEDGDMEDGMTDDSMTDDSMTDDSMTDDSMDDDEMGTMQMAEVDEVACPAGERVVLEPGGFHIMLFELVEPLVEGESFEITLQFEKAGSMTATVEVRAA